MKMIDRTRTYDILIVLVSVFVLAFSGLVLMDKKYFFHNSLIEQRRIKTNPIASIEMIEDDVRKKESGQIFWIHARKKDRIIHRDMVFVGKDSKTQIKFKDGTKIYLDENTLVMMKRKEKELLLHLKDGNLTASLGSRVKIQVGEKEEGKSLGGKGAQIAMSFDSKKRSTNLNVLSGKTKIQVSGKPHHFSKNQRIQFLKNAIQKVQIPKVELVHPESNAELWLQKDGPINFKWDSVIKGGEYEIIFGRNLSFREKFFSLKLQKNQFILKGDKLLDFFKAGHFYWKVRVLLKGEIVDESLIQACWIRQDTGPLNIFPKDKVSISYPKRKFIKSPHADSKHPILLSWEYKTWVKIFVVKVAKDLDFKKIVLEKEVKHTQFYTELPSGTYFWKVKPLGREKAPWGSITNFFIGEKALDFSPIPLFPKDNSIFDIKEKGKTIEFVWERVREGKFYEIEISKTASFSKEDIIETLVTSSTSLTRSLGVGNYYFRVRAINKRNELTRFSPPHNFRIKKLKFEMPPPETGPGPPEKPLKPPPIDKKIIKVKITKSLNTKINKSWFNRIFNIFWAPKAWAEKPKTPQKESQEKIKLSWGKIKHSKGYHIEISNDQNFKNVIISKIVSTNQYVVDNATPGVFYWRIYSINSLGIKGKPSTIGTLIVQIKPPVPKTEEEIVYVKERKLQELGNEEILFKWTKCRFAHKYELVIDKSLEFNRPKTFFSSKEYYYHRVDTRKPVYWKVRALDKKMAPLSEFSKVKRIEFKLEEKLDPPEVFPLEKNLFYFDEYAKLPVVKIKWINADPKLKINVQISKKDNFHTPIVDELATQSNFYEYQITNRKSASYYVRVRAIKGKNRSQWSQSLTFKTLYFINIKAPQFLWLIKTTNLCPFYRKKALYYFWNIKKLFKTRIFDIQKSMFPFDQKCMPRLSWDFIYLVKKKFRLERIKKKVIRKKRQIPIAKKKQKVRAKEFFFEYEKGYVTHTIKNTDYMNTTSPYISDRFSLRSKPFSLFKVIKNRYLRNFITKIYYQVGKISYYGNDQSGNNANTNAYPTYFGMSFYEYLFRFSLKKNSLQFAPVITYENYNLKSEDRSVFINIYFNAVKVGFIGRLFFPSLRSYLLLNANRAAFFSYQESGRSSNTLKNKSLMDVSLYSYLILNSSWNIGLGGHMKEKKVTYKNGDKTSSLIIKIAASIKLFF